MSETSGGGDPPNTPNNGGGTPNTTSDNNSRRSRNRNRNRNRVTRGPRFEGSITEISEFVYDISQGEAENFQKTTQGIGEYIARTLRDAGEFRMAFNPNNLGFPVIASIPDPDLTNPLMLKRWELAEKERMAHVNRRKELSQQAYAIVLGQCSQAVRDRLEASASWNTINESSDVIALLELIRSCLFSGATTRHPMQSLQDAEDAFMTIRQGANMSNAAYLERFRETFEVYEHLGGRITPSDAIVKTYLPTNLQDVPIELVPPAALAKATNDAREQYLAVRFLRRSDPRRYDNLRADVINDHTRGQDTYPTSLSQAYNMLVDFVDPTQGRGTPTPGSGLSFLQDGDRNGGGRGAGGNGGGRGSNGGRGGGTGRGGGRGRGDGGSGGRNSNNSDTTTDNNPSNDAVNPYSRAELLMQDYGGIPSTWILADSCSSINIIATRSLVHNIHEANVPLTLHSNTGTALVTKKAYFGKYPDPVWFYPQGIANIMSLKHLTKHYRVTMDSAVKNALIMHNDNGTTYEFTPSGNGLYRYELPNLQDGEFMWNFVTTVADNAKNYTKREVAAAKIARDMQDILMHPGEDTMRSTAVTYLRNCPVTQADVNRAMDIFGPNVGNLKGKTRHRTAPHVPSGSDPVPDEILSRHRAVTLVIDIMFVNKVPFLLTLSRGIKFGTVEGLPDRQIPTISRCLQSVVRLYRSRGFQLTSILGDPEFEDLRPQFPMLNTCGAGEHVPDIERYVETVKDRVRSRHSRLPFRRLPRLVLTQLVSNAVLWLNALPARDGVSDKYSPRYILTGNDLTYDKHVKTPFGQYVQTHEDHTNDMKDRSLGAICLGPTGNKQGTHFFMNLTTGALIRRLFWTPLPMTELAIRRVNSLGARQNMPLNLSFANRLGEEILETLGGLPRDAFPDADDDDGSTYAPDDSDYDDDDLDDFIDADAPGDVPHAPIDDLPLPPGGNIDDLAPAAADAADDDDFSDDDDDADDDDDGSHLDTPPPQLPGAAVTPASPGATGVDSRDEETPVEDDFNDYEDEDYYDASMDVAGAYLDRLDASGYPDTPDFADPAESPGVDPESTGVEHPVESPGVNDRPVESPGVDTDPRTEYERFQAAEAQGRQSARSQTTTTGRPKRSSKPVRDESYVYLNSLLDVFDDNSPGNVYSLVTAQMTANKGVKVFGTAGEDAIAKELQQLLIRQVMHGVPASSLTTEQKKAALRYLMFLKEKRSGVIKGRGCADGRKQRLYKTKAETSSPTVTTESIFLTSLIDAAEKRYVMTCDVPGAFMQADIDEIIHVKLDGAILDILLRIDPTYQQFVTHEGKKKVLYTQLDKALYGTLQAALLFWKRMSKHLVDKMGFIINPYDFCVANKIINGKQCTIIWYVDDLKISHAEEQVVEDMLDALNNEFGKEAPLTATRGKVHEYLGMTLDYTANGKVKFTMKHHIDEIIKQIPESLAKGPDKTPAANHLFQVNEKATKLSIVDAVLFHRLTAQLLFVSKRARPDVQTAVSFLTTRVQSPDVDDWKKLGRALRWLRRTRNLPLILEANDMCSIEWWVDASYGVHPDMKSHTGATVSLGKGSVYSMSTRQKINTRSSTEAELVGVNDGMSKILWTRNFMEAQGYEVKSNIVNQDNESAMLLEKNGLRSSTKRTRHLEIRYFFITDNVERKTIEIKYCPTEDMLADYFTKPLQGAAFRKLLKLIMNVTDEILDAVLDSPSSPQECVGDACHESEESGTRPPDRKLKIPSAEVEKKISSHDNEWMAMNQQRQTYAEVVKKDIDRK